MTTLTRRWTKLETHPVQQDLWNSNKRFRVASAGRRSGKTEFAKRFGVKESLKCSRPDGWFIFAAPTRDQAKRIFWSDLKALVPSWAIAHIYESELLIRLHSGVELQVLGMDKPERVEGRPVDGCVCDEYGNMKSNVWTQNLRPALSTKNRLGWCWFIGVPEGRNHYYKLAKQAEKPEMKDWGHWTWHSADILDPEEIEAAKRDMDPLSYQQEYEGCFITFEGRAYYCYNSEKHADETIEYNPEKPLVVCLDFNTAPGVAAIAQELVYSGPRKDVSRNFTGVVGEVWIPQDSNTRRVANKILEDWGHHQGDVLLYGDATGGAKVTTSVDGSDWDLVREVLRPHFQKRLKFRVPRGNPRERVRVNAVNARLLSADGKIHLLANPGKAPHICDDFDGVTTIPGTAGELDKKADPDLTHISDALGYYIEKKHPIFAHQFSTEAA